jgi:hypothetical protein
MKALLLISAGLILGYVVLAAWVLWYGRGLR